MTEGGIKRKKEIIDIMQSEAKIKRTREKKKYNQSAVLKNVKTTKKNTLR